MTVSSVCFWRKVIGTRVNDTRAIDVFFAEEFSQSLHLFDTNVVGEQPVVTDAMKAWRQHVDEKATDELIGGQGHGLVSITPLAAIVLPFKGDAVFVAGDESAVGDRHSMGITRQVSEYGLRSGEGALGIDHPVYFA